MVNGGGAGQVGEDLRLLAARELRLTATHAWFIGNWVEGINRLFTRAPN